MPGLNRCLNRYILELAGRTEEEEKKKKKKKNNIK